MNTKKLVFLALLVGIGTVLHLVIVGFGAGMKPDMMLLMMFLGIILFPDVKSVLLLGIASGVLSALTTSFPAGQIPNMIDKPITAFVIFGLFIAFKKYRTKIVFIAILTALGTMVSGSIFLASALLLVGLPAPFSVLFVTVVLPAMALNTIFMIILYPIASSIVRRTNLVNQTISS